MKRKSSQASICLLILLAFSALGCNKEPTGAARAAEVIAGKHAEKQGNLHQAEKHYQKALKLAEQEGYASEPYYEDLHRVQLKIAEKYGE